MVRNIKLLLASLVTCVGLVGCSSSNIEEGEVVETTEAITNMYNLEDITTYEVALMTRSEYMEELREGKTLINITEKEATLENMQTDLNITLEQAHNEGLRGDKLAQYIYIKSDLAMWHNVLSVDTENIIRDRLITLLDSIGEGTNAHEALYLANTLYSRWKPYTNDDALENVELYEEIRNECINIIREEK